MGKRAKSSALKVKMASSLGQGIALPFLASSSQQLPNLHHSAAVSQRNQLSVL
jgi:hypothetical protein